jgi:AraC-like DNA-binding protein
MFSFAEKPFTINGVKSWVQCLDCFAKESNDHDKLIVENYHYHEYIEYLYALDADMNVWINGVPYHMESGDLIIINSGELHNISFNKSCHYICVKFSPRILYFDDNSLFEFKYVIPFLSNQSPQKLFHRKDFDGIDVHELTCEILDEWETQGPAYELLIRSDILKIFTGIFRYWDKQNTFRSESIITDSIKKALIYITENFDTATVKDVADYCGLSYNHFSASFKKIVGRSFTDYLNLIRINEAEKLLISTNKSITEIAFSCGFSSTSHLISRFREQKNITPGQLRKKMKGKPQTEATDIST